MIDPFVRRVNGGCVMAFAALGLSVGVRIPRQRHDVDRSSYLFVQVLIKALVCGGRDGTSGSPQISL